MGRDRNEVKRASSVKAGTRSAKRNPFSDGITQHDGSRIRLVPDAAEIIDDVINAGAALIISRTSDGGAVVVTLLDDGIRGKAYGGSQAELDQAFERLAATYSESVRVGESEQED